MTTNHLADTVVYCTTYYGKNGKTVTLSSTPPEDVETCDEKRARAAYENHHGFSSCPALVYKITLAEFANRLKPYDGWTAGEVEETFEGSFVGVCFYRDDSREEVFG